MSRTQELGDDPTSSMIPRIMARFDEYQSKENAKQTLSAIGAERAEEAIERARPSITAEALRTFALTAQAHALRLPREAQNRRVLARPACTEQARSKRFELLPPRIRSSLAIGRIRQTAASCFSAPRMTSTLRLSGNGFWSSAASSQVRASLWANGRSAERSSNISSIHGTVR
jgi:hypothetical protein